MAAVGEDSVLLGLCDGEMDLKRYKSSYLTNKVGGLPDWPPGVQRSIPGCEICKAPLVLLVQVYCPLDLSPYHRTLYVFCCPRNECRGRAESWTVLRCQTMEVEVSGKSNPPQSAPPLAATDWCEAADDWGMEEEEEEGEETTTHQTQDNAAIEVDMELQLQNLNLNHHNKQPDTHTHQDTHQDITTHPTLTLSPFTDTYPSHIDPKNPISPPHYHLQPYFISVSDQCDFYTHQKNFSQHEETLLREYERREGVSVLEIDSSSSTSSSSSSSSSSLATGPNDEGIVVDIKSEKYEKAKAKHGDEVFAKFIKKIQVCPEQILRYSRSGTPLFITQTTKSESESVSGFETKKSGSKTLPFVPVPVCEICGEARTFEMQLMPALVSLLQKKKEEKEEEEKEEKKKAKSPETMEENACKNSNNACMDGVTSDQGGVEMDREIEGEIDGEIEGEIEFGTVLVYSCLKSCWVEGRDSAVREYCLVQMDPDQRLFQ